ncbi:MAG: UTP--glucose-1-phosphate uridylyltransferase GalU [Gammaproteobacteria bacterium]|jgi:UTP--glucose-1-phosphate uridylyltransferase|nr:UTP--glucose-1-phosphate uridylyltransferase [Gammaproteobacteria bacterium]MDP6098014.1 UTP--glucose-1-phosphate uridylyltransferase GalU [Gammaproteobacteria bacterium]HJO11795.1 UTP--glucose-1-phosphate uridylyltransferase GalU [Gammaproteobacteria bacterium]
MKAIRKCLFPAAGFGTRFLPVTKAMPKEMLPIVTKPLIQYGVEEAMQAGISGMAVVTGRGKRAIEDHFDVSYELDQQIAGSEKEDLLSDTREIMSRCTFSYIRQGEIRGLGHAILTGEPLIGDELFAVILADDYCVAEGDSVLAQMVHLYEEYQCSIIAIEEVPQEESFRYGIIEGETQDESVYRISNLVEKPAPTDAPSNLAIVGRYILTPDIFDIIRNTAPGRNGEVQITDALQSQAAQGKVIGYRFEGRRFDCGSVSGFIDATNYTYNKQNPQ